MKKIVLMLMLMSVCTVVFAQIPKRIKIQYVGKDTADFHTYLKDGVPFTAVGGAGLMSVADTTELKALSDTVGVVSLAQLGPSLVGGGLFSEEMDSLYKEGVVAFGTGTQGKQRVRLEFLSDPTTVRAEWAGNRTQVALDALPSTGGTLLSGDYIDSTLASRFDALSTKQVVWIKTSNITWKANGTKLVIPQHSALGDTLVGVGLVIFRETANDLHDITVEGVEIDGQGKYNSEVGRFDTPSSGMVVGYGQRITLRRLSVHDVFASGIACKAQTDMLIDNCYVARGNHHITGGNGIDLFGLSNVAPTDSSVTGTEIYDNRGLGNKIVNCTVEDFDLGLNISWGGTLGVIASTNHIRRCTIGIDVEVASGLNDNFPIQGYATIIGNDVRDGRPGAIFEGDTTRITPVAISTHGFAEDTNEVVRNVIIASNHCYNAGAIALEGGLFGIIVKGNEIILDRYYSENPLIRYPQAAIFISPSSYPNSIEGDIQVEGNRIFVEPNRSLLSGFDGISIDPGAPNRINGVKVLNNTVRLKTNFMGSDTLTQYAWGILLNDSTMNAEVSGNTVEGFFNGIFCKTLFPVALSQNHIYNSLGNGLYMWYGAPHSTIDHNYIFNNGQKTSLSDVLRSGMYLSPNRQLDSSLIEKNYVYDDQTVKTQTYGLAIEASATVGNPFGKKNRVLNNWFGGNSVSRFNIELPSDWEYQDSGAYKFDLGKMRQSEVDSVFYGGTEDYDKRIEYDTLYNILQLDTVKWWVRLDYAKSIPTWTLYDSSGFGNNWSTDGTATFYANALNGHRAASVTTAWFGSAVISDAWTVGVLVKAPDVTQVMAGVTQDLGNVQTLFMINGTPNTMSYGDGIFSGTPHSVVSSALPSGTSDFAFYEWKKSGSTVTMYQNGVEVGSGTVNSGNDTIAQFARFQGEYLEAIIIDDDLSDADRALLEGYINTKYYVNSMTLRRARGMFYRRLDVQNLSLGVPQQAHYVLAGPTSNPPAIETFRPLVESDIPAEIARVTDFDGFTTFANVDSMITARSIYRDTTNLGLLLAQGKTPHWCSSVTGDTMYICADSVGAGGGDADAIHDNVAGEIAAIADKATPTTSDHLIIEDAADTDAKKDITIGSLETALEGILDLSDLQGAVTDGQVPNNITVDVATTVPDAAITLAKMANLAQNTIIGRVTASTGVPEALTPANALTILESGGTNILTSTEGDAAYQPLDADLTDLADGTLSGSKVGTGINDDNVDFDDADGNFTATTIGVAIEELDDVINGGVPNSATAKVDWSELANVPAGFADGTDDTGGAGVWTDADPMMQSTTTRDVAIGAAQINSAKLSIDGDADQVQFSIQGHSTQTSNLVTVEKSDGTDVFTVDNTGAASFGGAITAPNIFTASNPAANRIPYYTSGTALDAEAAFTYDPATNTLTADNVLVATEAYDATGWNADLGAPTKDAVRDKFETMAPTDVDYLVGTASAGLSAEIVVGTSPGGELGNTWASPTLDDNITVSGWTLQALTSIAIPTAAGSSTLSSSGQIAYNTTNKLLGVYNGTKEVGIPTIYHSTWSFDPKAVCDGTVDRLFLMSTGISEPFGIHLLAWKISFEADPTTEVDLDLKRADAFIGVANSAVADVLDTTTGASSEATSSNINGDAVIATNKVLYLEFGTAYTEANHQINFELWWEVEED